MKTLILLRHGQAERFSDQGDRERPLTQQGRQDAARAAARIRSEIGIPEWIVSSVARRARETAEIAAQTLEFAGEIRLESAVYEAEPQTLLSVIQALPVQEDSVLLVGHNPGLEDLVWALDQEQTPAPMSLGTAEWTAFDFAVPSWQQICPHTGRRLDTERRKS